ncbi:hypothetical protein ADK70_33555 [Streptomyces rimosus subsp. pseudoverticillatus]|uniref:hypothetical protein n=1 Tax=Streptomyces rimosus TaxID=1927 RepID=UPI0006B266BF|nr:hypothetical protein [Streptomyces rimosus]KOT78673.1 hypothetical protein ADK70_33555 [Streptomyces rimosus subsp. pseudoverticillatus]
MDTLSNRAEAQKIAQLLDVLPEQLDFLHGLPAEDVRQLRARTVDALYDDVPDMLDRIAAATKLVPAGVAAAISQKALGPRLAASVAGRLEPARAADIIEKLPVAFTAESCGHLDPRRIAAVVDRLDEDLVVRIAVALAERGDHLTMGRFVGHLREGALRRVLQLIDDGVVLRVGFFIDMPERLDAILDLMGEERLASVVAAAGDGLWPEALAVAGLAGPERRARMAALAARQDPVRLDGLVRTAHEQGLWEALLPLVALLSEEDRRAVAALPSLRDAEVLGGVVRAVVATGLWAEFLPLVGVLPPESRKAVADAAGELPDAELDAMVLDVEKRDLWDAVLPLVELMDEPAKERVFALPAFQEQGRQG